MELSELLEQIDAVEYISQYVELVPQGGEWWGLSPFKEENTPSFSVRPETGRFYDFSSGIGGTVFTFTKYYFHCSGREAFDMLLAYAGFDPGSAKYHHKLSATMVCRQFAKAAEKKKPEGEPKVPQDVMLRYEDDPEKLKIWTDEGIAPEVLRDFEVKYDRLSDRIVYPIRDASGRVVNVGARTLDPDWKEKKLRKYTYCYKWNAMNVIYGLYENRDEILKEREIILFEGCKSVLKAKSWGVDNTGALLTSHLSENQMKLLISLGCDAVFALDEDVDIRKDRNIEKLRRYVNVFYIRDRDHLLQEKDSPVDQGEEIFRKLYEGRIRYR